MLDLLCLPTELILEVFSYLDLTESGNFRLSCRNINLQVQPEADRQFAQNCLGIPLEHESLEKLVAIAQDPRMSLLVKKLAIGNRKWLPGTVMRMARERHETEYMKSPFEGYLAKKDLRNSGEARHLLSQAFRHFKNLDTVSIAEVIAKLQDCAKEETTSYDGIPHAKESIIPLVLLALTDASTRPTKIYIEDSGRYANSGAAELLRAPISLHIFTIPPRSGLSSMLNTLTVLSLGLKLSRYEARHYNMTSTKRRAKTEAPLRRFMSYLTSLNTLILRFHENQSLAWSLLEWLGKASNEELGAGLSKLRVLQTEYITAPISVFTALCQRFRLDEIHMFRPTIACEAVEHIGFNHWGSFIHMLSNHLAAIKHSYQSMSISWPGQCPISRALFLGEKPPTWVQFGFGGAKENPSYAIEYTSGLETKTADQWLEEVAKHTSILDLELRYLDSDESSTSSSSSSYSRDIEDDSEDDSEDDLEDDDEEDLEDSIGSVDS